MRSGVNESGTTCLRSVRVARRSDRHRGGDVLAVSDRHHLAAHQAGVDRPPHDDHRDARVLEPLAERGVDRHRQEDRRKGERDVDRAHHHLVDPTAEEPGDRAQRVPISTALTITATEIGIVCRAPVERTREHVAAEGIGAERVLPRRRLQPLADGVERVVRRPPLHRQDGEEPEHDDDDPGDDRRP